MTAPPMLRVPDFGKDHRRHHRIQEIRPEQTGDDRSRAANMQIDGAHAGVLLFGYFINITRAACDAELKLDAGIGFLKPAFEFLAQLSAGGNRDNDPPFLPGGFDDLFPLRVFRLCESWCGKQQRRDEDINNRHEHISNHRRPYPPRSLRAKAAAGSRHRLSFSSD